MRLTYKSPLKRKLRRVIMLTSLISLLLATAAFVVYDYFSFRGNMVRDMSTLAAIIAENSKSSIIFNDPNAANDTLASLHARPGIMSAAVYKTNGEFFAGYTRPGLLSAFPRPPRLPGHLFSDGRLILFYPIVLGKPIGTLYIESDLQRLYDRLQSYASIALMVLVCSAIAALIIATRLQKSISQPVLELAETARRISTGKDYSVRAKEDGDEEIGFLAETFNEMLEQIQTQDAALRRSNEALGALNRELEERVARRTAALREANDQMQLFTYTVAHDLRAPLRSMMGFSQIIRDEFGRQMEPAAVEYLQRIHQSSEHMDSLIRDLLSYSRLSREELKFEPVSLSRVVENALSFQAADIKAAKAHVTLDGPLFLVIGHAATLENVIMNLISNAIKYVANVVPSIHIHAEDLGQTVRLWIEDNGIGVPREFQEKIFGIFTRLHGSNHYSGTGIGLAIVRKGVERMSGRCGVESESGKGSRFWIELPKAAAS